LWDAQGNDVQVVLRSRMPRHRDRQEDVLLMNVVDVSQRRRYEDQLARLIDHDTLTGLPNRRRFEAELRRHGENCRRDGPIGALLLLDLDHFKQVNDTLGHAVGDELLASVAGLLRQRVRSTDVVARLGGDEFAVLLTQGDQQGAETVARSVVRMIAGHTSGLDRARRRVTASVGVVTFRAARERDVDVLALADMTMYDAKEAGRNQIAVLDEISAQPPRTGARWQWESRIEEAVENDHFVLHLQPILDLRRQEVGAAEVLLRLRDGDQLVTPSRFLDIAERAGLVPVIDAWVVRHSVALLSRLHTVQPDFRLEVNLSGLSIGNLEIERVIVDSLRAHMVDPATLILEITETAAIADVALARQFAERITALGCKFALDDFGAGFGSFYYLKHLLFDYVKIDGEFVSNCSASSVDRTIIRSIVRIARDLGKETVAEFVADKAVLNVIRAEGVDHAQGYLVGEPMSEERFVELLRGDGGRGLGNFDEAAQANVPPSGRSRR
jgi:diguanylate cyclase (GGDEF)-like protein